MAFKITFDLFLSSYETIHGWQVKLYSLWIIITGGIYRYGFWQYKRNFWIWPLYKLSCDPKAFCLGCDPEAIWKIGPWSQTKIIQSSNSLYLFTWVNRAGVRSKYLTRPTVHSEINYLTATWLGQTRITNMGNPLAYIYKPRIKHPLPLPFTRAQLQLLGYLRFSAAGLTACMWFIPDIMLPLILVTTEMLCDEAPHRSLVCQRNKIPTENGHKLQRAPQHWLGYSPPTSAKI